MLRSRLIGALAVLCLAGSPSPAADPDPADRVIFLSRCEVEYVRSSQIGVAAMETTATILQDCYVKEGDRVKTGQVLGRIMDKDLRAELELKTAMAENDIEVRVTEGKYAQSLSRLKRSDNLLRRGRDLISEEEYNLQKLDTNSAALAIEDAKQRRHLAALQKRQVEARLHAREFVSPHDGIVVEVLKNQGEALAVNEAVFRVVDVDRLKVTGHLNLSDYWRVKKGQRVRIFPDIEGVDLSVEHEEFSGRVTFVDSRIDPVNRTCKIVTEVENRGLMLVSGLEARMEIDTREAPAAAPAVPGLPARPKAVSLQSTRPSPIDPDSKSSTGPGETRR